MTDAPRLWVNSVNRRTMMVNAAKVGLVAGSLASISHGIVRTTSAQESSPEPNVFPPVELPILELEIDADGAITTNAEAQAGTIDQGVSHMSGQTQAGTTVIRCTSHLEEPATAFFLFRPAESMNDVSFRQSVLAPDPRWWMFDQPLTATFTFDPERTPMTQDVVADVAPGLWRIIIVGAVQTFTTIEFVGDGAFVQIPADVTVQAMESGCEMPAEIPAGSHVWKFSNSDDTLHEFAILSMPGTNSITENAFPVSQPESTPAADGESTLKHVAGIPFISSGQTMYREIDLAPGSYLGVCTMPNAGSSTPHFLGGMIVPFNVV